MLKTKTLTLLLGFALLTAAALAGITSTEAPTVYMILLADNSIEKGKEWPKTEQECVERAKAIIPQGSCSIRRTFTNAGTCADVAKPKWPLEKDADGYVIKPPIRAKQLSDTDWQTEIQDYVPAPYPTCWVLGWRIIADADLNDETQKESINVMEPVPVSAEFQAWWESPEAEAQRHLSGYCYDSDKTPCPVMPVIHSACGPYNGVGCGGPG